MVALKTLGANGLMSKVETSDEWHSSGVGIGTSTVEHLCQ